MNNNNQLCQPSMSTNEKTFICLIHFQKCFGRLTEKVDIFYEMEMRL